ncbi:hypothetical protein GCM10027290_29560 [Micromonospora sonneratiae]|uniref:GPP34 family phosphoprotein n=1 Tax=Micromonospora sonneratiae TaxID=1184706 RepID=A0ABW3YIH3_9ACTN
MEAALADQFYRLAYSDVTGRPRLAGRAAGLGLAAALLGELVFRGNVWVKGRRLSIRACGTPADALAHAVFDQLVARPELTDLRTWVLFLAGSAPEDVARRLARGGHLRREQKRRRLRRETVWVPTNMNVAATPWALLSVRLRRLELLSHEDMFLAGLCVATGLDRLLFDGASPQARRYLTQVSAGLWPPALELVDVTSALVADAILSAR